MRKERTKFGCRTFSIPELIDFLPKLQCTRSEALKLAAQYNLHPRITDTLRSILGFTENVPEVLSQEVKDKAIKLYLDNPDKSAYRLFVENRDTIGLSDYQSFYHILKNNGIETNRKRDYWTKIKDKKLLYLRDTKKLSFPKIHEQMPERTVNALQFRYYKLKGYKIPSRTK